MGYTIVIVLYNCLLENSPTLQSLYPQLSGLASKDYQLIIYDNSANSQAIPEKYSRARYIHDKRNLGISEAYNFALTSAIQAQSQWLWVFDQDSTLAHDFIQKMIHASSYSSHEDAAIIPIVLEEESQISPVSMETYRPLKEEELPSPGIHTDSIMGICSGSMVNVEFIKVLGGFSRDFPLDYLDHWLFYQIHSQKKKIIVSDATMCHDLSVMDFSTMSRDRYRRIIYAEALFYRKYNVAMAKNYPKHLFLRGMKQLLKVRNKRIGLATLNLCWQFKMGIKPKKKE